MEWEKNLERKIIMIIIIIIIMIIIIMIIKYVTSLPNSIAPP